MDAPMQQDQHPDHNMPAPEFQGKTISAEAQAYIESLRRSTASNRAVQPAKGEYDK